MSVHRRVAAKVRDLYIPGGGFRLPDDVLALRDFARFAADTPHVNRRDSSSAMVLKLASRA